MKELRQFLIEAKKGTYANGSAKKCESSRLGSKDYEYQSGNMLYHDTYFGGLIFVGEEVVYKDGTPIWGMNYRGVTLDASLEEETIDKALRPALMQVGEDDILPLRGPREYRNGEYSYTFKVTGTLEDFVGEEEICKDSIPVYRLTCHGGIIK